MVSFGQQLRRLRIRARLGLRTFSELIGERCSIVSAIELGKCSPWRRQDKLLRVADVLGLAPTSEFCDEFFQLAQAAHSTNGAARSFPPRSLAWWCATDDSPTLEPSTIGELAAFVGAEYEYRDTDPSNSPYAYKSPTEYPLLTDLAVEWRVRKLLGRRMSSATAPVDIEAVLESAANVEIEVVAGLIPRFSLQACAVFEAGSLKLLVDRIVADSRPLASYRQLLAHCFAPAALWVSRDQWPIGDCFCHLQQSRDWLRFLRDCERFALSMLLPADPILSAAEVAYREVVEQQGWIDVDTAARAVRNRLAEQFAVPPLLVHTRLVRWPCHLYGRIAQALAAEELTLPPVDWFEEEPSGARQGMLFAK